MPGPAGTEESILEAAEELFGRHGFKKTTLEDVAAAAQVSRPLVYRYFGDKQALFGRVLERVLREWNEVLVAEASRESDGTPATLRNVLVACLGFARTRTVLRGLLLRDAGLVRAAVGDVLDEGRRRLPELVRQILARGAERGDVRRDLEVDDMAHVVSEVFVSYALQALGDGTGELDHRRVDTVIATLLHGVITRG